MKTLREEMNNQLSQMMLMIQQNPKIILYKARNSRKNH